MAEIIREDGIDILVDLSGHTKDNRLLVFGQKPAPIQVTGIGHLAPGLSTIDYRLTTSSATFPEEEPLFPEKPIYLSTWFGFLPPLDSPSVVSPPCLNNSGVTFGYMNRLSKVSDDAMALWAKIIQHIPNSKLLIKYYKLDDPEIRQRTLEAFTAAGIPKDRLILLGGTPQREHLEAYNQVDIALDPFPHGGGITTMESLWMGVPVLGLYATPTTATRSIRTFCQPLDLHEWIAEDTDTYLRRAIEWADRREDLSEIRSGLRQRVADVYSRFPREVEQAYRTMWRRWCDGQEPVALDLVGTP